MVATKIIRLHSTLWVPLLSNEVSGHDVIEFSQKLPQLRRAFTCCVCDQLMTNREVIAPSTCLEHFVCKACRGKDRLAGRKCSKCEDWDSFGENRELEVLIQSYQMLCRYILTCEKIVRLLEVKHEVDPGFDTFKLIDLLAEGLKGAPGVGVKRKLPGEVVRAGRGVVPMTVAVPVKRMKKIQPPPGCLSEDGSSTGSSGTSSPAPALVSSVGKKVDETSSAKTQKTENPVGPIDKSKQPVATKQTEKVVIKTPPVTTPQSLASKPNVSAAKQQITTTSTVSATSSPATKTSTVPSPGVAKSKAVPSPVVTKSVTVPSPVVQKSAVPSSVAKPATVLSPLTKSVSVSAGVTKATTVPSTVTKPTTLPSAVTKSTTVVTLTGTQSTTVSSPVTRSVPASVASCGSSASVVKTEAQEGQFILPDKPLNVSVEADRSPIKASEEDTYILGLSPQTSPIKVVNRSPSSTPNIMPTAIISSSPATITMNSLPSTSFKLTPNLAAAAQRSGGPHFVQFRPGDGIMRTVQIGGQRIQLSSANIASFPHGRIPVQFLRQGVPMPGTGIIGAGVSGSPPLLIGTSIQSATNPSTSGATAVMGTDPTKRKIYLSSATAQDLQLQWAADPNRRLQFHTQGVDFGGGIQTFATLGPNIISVTQGSLQTRPQFTSTQRTVTNVGSIATTPSLVRPTSTHMVHTLPRGTGTVRQTMTRATAPTTNRMTMHPAANLQFVRTSGNAAGPVIMRTEGMASPQPAAASPSQVPVSTTTPTTNNPLTTTTSSVSKRKQEGCRCGNATPTPGKLTCIGQRCACYAEKTACLDCKCKGCKNPYVPGGQKVLPGVRSLIDPQTNQTIPLLAAPMNSGGGGHTTATFVNAAGGTNPNPTIMTAIGPASNIGSMQAGPSMQNSGYQLIKYGPTGTPQFIQFSNAQGLQQLPIILSSTGHLQASSGGGITIQGLQGMSVGSFPGLVGLSSAGGPVQQVSAPQLLRPNMVPVTGSLQVERGPNE